VQCLDDLVGELIAGVFEVLDRRLVGGHRPDLVVERGLQQPCRGDDVSCLAIEELVEPALTPQETRIRSV
jgi:hypothetical protein